MTTEPLVPTASPSRTPSEAALSTFLFTDIEGSTRLWEQHPVAMRAALATHDGIIRAAVATAGGTIVKTTGDGILAVFEDPAAAVGAAVAAQRELAAAAWGETGPLRVRMALHAGSAEARDGDYFGPALNRVARILSIGHGEQILASAVATVLARDQLPVGIELLDLGSHRLRDLDRPEEVFQVAAPGLRRSFPPLRSLSTGRTNLPIQLTSFVGRDRELAEVAGLTERHRLVTLIGTGGTGKTRLMLEVAGRVAGRFADGAWLAELAPLSDPAQIPSEMARAMGVPEEPGQPAIQTITAFLGGKDLLLLVDNAEHLVDGVASIAERLLGAAPGLRIIATSREALAVSGEAVFQVQSLACPSVIQHGVMTDDLAPPDLATIAATEAVRLFVERAVAVAPEFALDPANVGAVADICRRLDGIPLAIELAAARVSAMSPVEIARRLGDRFRLLVGGRRTAVARQQTLHALIDWSWELLTDDDRRLLRRLSVFAGGWTADLAAPVVADDGAAADEVELVDGLSRLVDRSLVVVDRGQATTRYRMLETIRQYAREQLAKSDEATTIADRHFAAFKGLAEAAAAELRGPAMGDWLDRLDAEVDNLGAAMEWGLEASPWAAVEMAAALMSYWSSRVASSDVELRIMAAIDIARQRTAAAGASPTEQAVAARLLGEAARIWAMAGRPDLGFVWAEEAMRLASASGDLTARAIALGGFAIACAFTGRGSELKRLFADVAEVAEASGQSWFVAMSAGFAGASSYGQDPDEAEVLVRRGEEAAARSGNPNALAATSMARGRLLGLQRRPDEAAAAFQRAIDRFAEIGDTRFALASRSDLAHALRRGARYEEAAALYRETIGGWV
ncbi:MAG TPA: adenylate/guanylate cyclase domain-containing protein, partial [Candidatus Limnocylindrales bacterium]|nr:adenylate/guanylate cyclase domain-containing protein [Candidatus Limnocylindrales bacterium]